MTSDRVRARRDTVGQLALQGRTPAQIAEATGQTLAVIHGDLGYLKYFGITAPRARNQALSDPDRERIKTIARLASKGKTRKEIAAETGIPYQQVCYTIRRTGMEIPAPPPKRQQEHDSAIAQNQDIRLMAEAGFSSRQIGAALGPGRVNATLRLRGLHLTAADPATIFKELDTQPRNLTPDGALALRAARHLLSGRSITQAAKLLGVPVGDVRAVVKAFGVREALENARAGRRDVSEAS